MTLPGLNAKSPTDQGPGTVPGSASSGISITIDELIDLRRQAASIKLDFRRSAIRQSAGMNASRFRGRGMEFSESRIYLPGDDVRSMDWKVTARTGEPHTKLFQEERERPVFLLVDLSASMYFGTRGTFKSVLAARAASVIAWAALQHGDRVGALVFSGGQHVEVRPSGGPHGVLAVLRAIAEMHDQAPDLRHADGDINLASALLRAGHVARPGSLVFIFSDFYDLDNTTQRHISRLRKHNDVVACWINDPLESTPPPAGRYPITNGSSRALLDTFSITARDNYRHRFSQIESQLQNMAANLGVALVPFTCGTDVVIQIRRRFAAALTRRRHGGHR